MKKKKMTKKKTFEFKQGHGYFKGYVKQTDVISTIDSGMAEWHILLWETYEDDETETTRRSV